MVPRLNVSGALYATVFRCPFSSVTVTVYPFSNVVGAMAM